MSSERAEFTSGERVITAERRLGSFPVVLEMGQQPILVVPGLYPSMNRPTFSETGLYILDPLSGNFVIQRIGDPMLSFGRDERHSFVLSDTYASGNHAYIYSANGKFVFADMSKNGTKAEAVTDLPSSEVQIPIFHQNVAIFRLGSSGHAQIACGENEKMFVTKQKGRLYLLHEQGGYKELQNSTVSIGSHESNDVQLQRYGIEPYHLKISGLGDIFTVAGLARLNFSVLSKIDNIAFTQQPSKATRWIDERIANIIALLQRERTEQSSPTDPSSSLERTQDWPDLYPKDLKKHE